MSERGIRISVGKFSLEALYDPGESPDGALICHPHPLYGGSMDNNVVSVLQKALRKGGWGTLRFNFRGVDGSGGDHAGSKGDVEDLLAAAEVLLKMGKAPLHLAGYSYGSWIALQAIRSGLQPSTLILASPPVDFVDFDGLVLPESPCLITAGEYDDFCTLPSLKAWLSAQLAAESHTRLEVIPRCDHFYWGREDVLEAAVVNFLQGVRPHSGNA